MDFLSRSLKAKLIVLTGVILAATVAGLILSMNAVLKRSQDVGRQAALKHAVQSLQGFLESQAWDMEVQARLVGELPILTTVIEGGNPATIRDAASTYRENLKLPVLDILDTDGGLITHAGDSLPAADTLPAAILGHALEEGTAKCVLRTSRGPVLVALSIIGNSDEPGGILLLGRPLDSAYLARFKAFAHKDVSVLSEGRVLATTLRGDEEDWRGGRAAPLGGSGEAGRLLAGRSLFTAEFPIAGFPGLGEAGSLALHHSLREDLALLRSLQAILLGIGCGLFLLAAGAMYKFSDGVTRPLADAVAFARSLAAGDIDRSIRATRKDEIGTLQGSLEKMRVSIKELLGNLDAKIREVTGMQKHVRNILDNLDSGFLQFDRSGRIQPGYSRTTESFFGPGLEGRLLEEALQIDPSVWGSLATWRDILFGEVMPFAHAAPLGPSRFEKLAGRHVELQYRPVTEDGRLTGVIMVATDRTAEQELMLKSQREKERADLILKLSLDREGFIDFVRDSKGILARMQSLVSAEAPGPEELDQLFRGLHTLKGNSAMFGMSDARDLAHRLENEIANLRSAGEAAGERPDLGKLAAGLTALEDILDATLRENRGLLGEAALTDQDLRRVTVPANMLAKMEREMLSRFRRDSEVFRLFVDAFVLEPLLPALRRYESVAESVAGKRGKKLQPIEWRGAVKVRLPHYKPLLASLVHAFRNAVDHGIELPEERIEAEKDPAGRLVVAVERTGSAPHRLRIVLKDDGRGIDAARIRAKAVEKGLLGKEAADGLSDSEALQLVFRNGLSTNESVTEISGRGVGMDAIRYEARKLGGTAWVESEPGKGTSLHIEVPLFAEAEEATADWAGEPAGETPGGEAPGGEALAAEAPAGGGDKGAVADAAGGQAADGADGALPPAAGSTASRRT